MDSPTSSEIQVSREHPNYANGQGRLGGLGDLGTRGQGDKGTRGQGDNKEIKGISPSEKRTRRQGDKGTRGQPHR